MSIDNITRVVYLGEYSILSQKDYIIIGITINYQVKEYHNR